ncbi:MAG: sulfatase-like hydrolase/transferase [Acidobacteriia bacterium]|nr:sulfatase-like hydrolase/transferase [Terriglobia bacterium]
MFLSDDMGWEQVGFNGGKEVRTPNIDRIADEGVKLTQFYVQPVCSPTRACLLTGRYAWKTEWKSDLLRSLVTACCSTSGRSRRRCAKWATTLGWSASGISGNGSVRTCPCSVGSTTTMDITRR